MNKLEKLAQKLKNSKELVHEVMFDILTEDDMLKKESDLQRERLSERGTYFDGKQIRTYGAITGVYSPMTIAIKQAKGQRTDIVTLKDTGSFHSSIQQEIGDNEIFTSADFDKEDGNIGDNVDAERVLGFDDISMIELAKDIKGRFRETFLKKLK